VTALVYKCHVALSKQINSEMSAALAS